MAVERVDEAAQDRRGVAGERDGGLADAIRLFRIGIDAHDLEIVVHAPLMEAVEQPRADAEHEIGFAPTAHAPSGIVTENGLLPSSTPRPRRNANTGACRMRDNSVTSGPASCAPPPVTIRMRPALARCPAASAIGVLVDRLLRRR